MFKLCDYGPGPLVFWSPFSQPERTIHSTVGRLITPAAISSAKRGVMHNMPLLALKENDIWRISRCFLLASFLCPPPTTFHWWTNIYLQNQHKDSSVCHLARSFPQPQASKVTVRLLAMRSMEDDSIYQLLFKESNCKGSIQGTWYDRRGLCQGINTVP